MVEMRVYLAETTSGVLLRQLDGTRFTWKDELNAAGGGEIVISKRDNTDLSVRQLSPWWGSIIATFVDDAGRETPKFGGPITSPAREDAQHLTLSWAGMREVFNYRYLSADLKLSSTTPGQAAWRILQEAQKFPGGVLPLKHGIASESGSYSFSVDSWNVANNRVTKLLDRITEEAGPDMMFRPVWNDVGASVEWKFVHGTAHDVFIPQGFTPEWDTTVPQTDVSEVDIVSDSTHLASQVRVTGAGQGKGIALSAPAQNLKRVQRGYPFMEQVFSMQDEKDPVKLSRAANAKLRDLQQPLDQVVLKVSMGGRHNSFARWNVGDAAYVTLGGNWRLVPPGRRLMRVIRASGDLHGLVTVDMQEDQWGE